MTIKLGDRVKDVYTKFTGIATGRTEWLHGCTRIGITPEKLDKDNKPIDTHWFDEPQVELVKAQPVKTSKGADTSKPGGPRPAPRRNSDPSR